MKFFDESGNEINFTQFLRDMGGSGVIYERDMEKMLKSCLTADWVTVNEFIGPLAAEVITDAAEMHPVLYEKIMKSIIEAYDIMKKELALKPSLTRIK